MNLIARLKQQIFDYLDQLFSIEVASIKHFEFKINVDQEKQFGDISCNVAMIIAKQIGKQPREIALELQKILVENPMIQEVDIAGPGFLNLTLTPAAWQTLISELCTQQITFFSSHDKELRQRYLIEFVSANPTGPLHLGHGRGGIIGDTLARVLNFLGHKVHKEFYINDAGNQIKLLGQTLKVRCLQQLGESVELPEGGYAGDYMVDLASDCVAMHGQAIKEKSDQFFELYAKEYLLNLIQANLQEYGIAFDSWFSEKTLHDNSAIDRVLFQLKDAGLVYEQEGAWWFKSTEFGDDKDRVVKKSNGELTYIAADIAYHNDKFTRGYDKLIDILGHDHHGYVRRLKATMAALGYDPDCLDVILYQLVTIKSGGQAVRMSKRAGTFTKLSDVVQAVGTDVARFFYLHRKNDAPLDFDLDTALKKTEENPVYYIQYAYVRINSLLQKAEQEGFGKWLDACKSGHQQEEIVATLMKLVGEQERLLIKKIASLYDVLRSIASSYHTHLLSYYALELAQKLHVYYTKNKVIDGAHQELSKMRLGIIFMVHQTLGLSLDLLGLHKPEKM